MKDVKEFLKSKKEKKRPETAIIILVLIVTAAATVGLGWFTFAEAGFIAGVFLTVHLALESKHHAKHRPKYH